MTPPSDIDLLAFDIDGTAAYGKKLSPGLPQAIAEVRRTGRVIVIATGRTARGALPVAREMGLLSPRRDGESIAYLISSEGAVTRSLDPELRASDYTKGSIIRQDSIPADTAAKLLSFVREMGWYMEIQVNFTHQPALGLAPNWGETQGEQQFTEMIHLPGGTARKTRMNVPVEQVENLDPYLSGGITSADLHVGTGVGTDEREAGVELLAAALGPHAKVLSAGDFISVSAPGVSKGAALEHLCKLLRIEPKKMAVFGNDLNDVPMAKVAGLTVAVERSPRELLELAGMVCRKPEEAGVTQALYSLGLTRRTGRTLI